MTTITTTITPPIGTPGILSNPEQIRRFLLGGRAIVTFVGRSTRYTFQIIRREPTGNYTEPVYFVRLLTGSDNTSDYTYIGIVSAQTGQIRLTAKSTYQLDSRPVVAWNFVTTIVWAGRELPAGVTVWHVGRCGRCGRALTVPSSIADGFGPECRARLEDGE